MMTWLRQVVRRKKRFDWWGGRLRPPPLRCVDVVVKKTIASMVRSRWEDHRCRHPLTSRWIVLGGRTYVVVARPRPRHPWNAPRQRVVVLLGGRRTRRTDVVVTESRGGRPPSYDGGESSWYDFFLGSDVVVVDGVASSSRLHRGNIWQCPRHCIECDTISHHSWPRSFLSIPSRQTNDALDSIPPQRGSGSDDGLVRTVTIHGRRGTMCGTMRGGNGTRRRTLTPGYDGGSTDEDTVAGEESSATTTTRRIPSGGGGKVSYAPNRTVGTQETSKKNN